MNNCRKIQNALRAELWADFDERRRAEIDSHVATCNRCRILAERLRRVDVALSTACLDSPAPSAGVRSSFTRTRVQLAAYALCFIIAAFLGTGFGVKYGVSKLFGEAYAADLRGHVEGLKNLGFDEGRLSENDDWFASRGTDILPIESLSGNNEGTPNFFEFDDETRDGSGQSLKLYLRSFGGSVSRTIEGPFPANCLVQLRAWVKMPKPGSTRNKWLSFGVGMTPANSGSDHAWSSTIDVFDASPHWRPSTLTTSLPAEASQLSLSFSTGAGDGVYEGWDRVAWIDDVQICVEVPIKGEARAEGERIWVRFAPPKGFDLSEDPTDLKLWTYGDRLPLLAPKAVNSDGADVLCLYEAPGLGRLVRGGNPDTGQPALPVQIRTTLSRGGLTFQGVCSADVLASSGLGGPRPH